MIWVTLLTVGFRLAAPPSVLRGPMRNEYSRRNNCAKKELANLPEFEVSVDSLRTAVEKRGGSGISGRH